MIVRKKEYFNTKNYDRRKRKTKKHDTKYYATLSRHAGGEGAPRTGTEIYDSLTLCNHSQNQFCIKFGQVNSFSKSKPVTSRPATRTKSQTAIPSLFFAILQRDSVFFSISIKSMHFKNVRSKYGQSKK